MADWLPWAFLGFVIVLLMAMPWRRPHPNHEFMLHMLRLLESSGSCESSSEEAQHPRNASTSIHRKFTA